MFFLAGLSCSNTYHGIVHLRENLKYNLKIVYLMMEKGGDDEPGGEDEHWDEVVEDQVVEGVHLEKRRK